MKVENKLKELGLSLPEDASPEGFYKPYKRSGNLIFVAGQTCSLNGKCQVTGVVGEDLSIEDGRKSAQISILRALAVLKDALGDLDKISQVVQMVSYVRCGGSFNNPALCIDAATELLYQLYGDDGLPARMATGAAMLPDESATEIMITVEVKE